MRNAFTAHKLVLPVADTGGDAKELYIHILRKWNEFEWMGLSQKDFQRLGRPGTGGIDAAIELALKSRVAREGC